MTYVHITYQAELILSYIYYISGRTDNVIYYMSGRIDIITYYM